MRVGDGERGELEIGTRKNPAIDSDPALVD